MPSTQSDAVTGLDGIDPGDPVIHVIKTRDPLVSFCGKPLDKPGDTWLPREEITEAAWCAVCVAIQDGLL